MQNCIFQLLLFQHRMIIIFRATKTGFKKTIKWIKYRSEMTKQTKTNSLNYLINPTFHEVNR